MNGLLKLFVVASFIFLFGCNNEDSGVNGGGELENNSSSDVSLYSSEYYPNPSNPLIVKINSSEGILEVYGEKDSEGSIVNIDYDLFYLSEEKKLAGDFYITEYPSDGVEIITFSTGDKVTIDVTEDNTIKYVIEYIDGDTDIWVVDETELGISQDDFSLQSNILRDGSLVLAESSNDEYFSAHSTSTEKKIPIVFEQCGAYSSNVTNVAIILSYESISSSYQCSSSTEGHYYSNSNFEPQSFSSDKLAYNYHQSLKYTDFLSDCVTLGTVAKLTKRKIVEAKKNLQAVIEKFAKKGASEVAKKLTIVKSLYDWYNDVHGVTKCLIHSATNEPYYDTGIYYLKDVMSTMISSKTYKASVFYNFNGERLEYKTTWEPGQTVNIKLEDSPSLKLIPPVGGIYEDQDYQVSAISSCSVGEQLSISVSGTDDYSDSIISTITTDPYDMTLFVPGAEAGVVDTIVATSTNQTVKSKTVKLRFK